MNACSNQESATLTVAIPTFGRETVLIETIDAVRSIAPEGIPILVIDQSYEHTPEVMCELSKLDREGLIQHISFGPPSITRAMNMALLSAKTRFVCFLDDDIIPGPELVQKHLEAHKNTGAALVAGRVIQPWQEKVDYSDATDFHFATVKPMFIDAFMGGNVSMDRAAALEAGGFDENFVRVCYNFEAEFAYRMLQRGHRIYYEPAATVHHLRTASGGTRTFGEHLKTMKPDHSVGAYYHIFRTWRGWSSFGSLIRRPIQSVTTRHHLMKPWWIPLTLIGEGRGFIWAARLARRGPRYVESPPAFLTRGS